ncbi:sugar-specific transcriptional regulator TrmB [bacterium BMS3Abin15]|nr:sugar-specific transcriptional regulator TrmB [bacterium BMS3Abin15]HDZ85037.1 TrmB family transcriptional regulator [Candidatus Moranbacteria bacterium]
MSLEQDLKLIGLEEKEAKVYLAALELGPTNIQNLTKKSGIKRSTVYEMIKNLQAMGLISETIKGKRKIYVASEPENLKRNIKAKEQLFNEILPELKSISNIGFVKPKITFYENREGLRNIYRDTLKIKNKLVLWVSTTQNIADTIGEKFLEEYIEERAKKKIWSKALHITFKKIFEYKYLNPETYEKTLREVRFAPSEIDLPNTIAIYDDKVAVISSRKEGFGFVVESKDYAKTMKVFYNLLWNISKPWHEMDFDSQDKNMENKEINNSDDDLDYWAKV